MSEVCSSKCKWSRHFFQGWNLINPAHFLFFPPASSSQTCHLYCKLDGKWLAGVAWSHLLCFGCCNGVQFYLKSNSIHDTVRTTDWTRISISTCMQTQNPKDIWSAVFGGCGEKKRIEIRMLGTDKQVSWHTDGFWEVNYPIIISKNSPPSAVFSLKSTCVGGN